MRQPTAPQPRGIALESRTGSRPGVTATGGTDREVVERFFAGWAPYAQLAAKDPVRAGIMRFLAAETGDQRRAALDAVNSAGRIYRLYVEMGIARDGNDPSADAVALSTERLASAIRAGEPKDALGVLQKCFEFGRTPAVPNQRAARTFLLEFLSLAVGGPAMKYCVYAKGLPFSAGGKSHEEVAREFVVDGFGSGNPLCGGLIARRGLLAYEFDTSSTVYRSGMRPDEVRAGILRWVRIAGGDDEKLKLTYSAAPVM
jgi:hypothetical protein